MPSRFEHTRVVNKSSSYTISARKDRSGTLFTTYGAAGTVAFTLPTPTKALLGNHYEILVCADFAVNVAAPTADTLLALNDIAADNLSVETATELIGGRMLVQCVKNASDAYRWAAVGIAAGHTYTVNT